MHRIEDIIGMLDRCKDGNCFKCPMAGVDRCARRLLAEAAAVIRAMVQENTELRQQTYIGKHERRSGHDGKGSEDPAA